MHDLLDNLIALRAERGRWSPSSVTYSARPAFPADVARARLKQRSRNIRDSKIAAAQQRWRMHNRDGAT